MTMTDINISVYTFYIYSVKDYISAYYAQSVFYSNGHLTISFTISEDDPRYLRQSILENIKDLVSHIEDGNVVMSTNGKNPLKSIITNGKQTEYKPIV